MSDIFYERHQKQELDEVRSFLLRNKHHLGEGLFSKYFPELYKDISKITFPFETKKFSQKLYHVLNMDAGRWELGLCKICGKRCDFKNFSIGYSQYCCCKCAGSDPEVNKKNRETNIRLHGKDYAQKRSRKGIETKSKFSKDRWTEIDEKRKSTKFEKYGDKNYNNNRKQQKTMLKKYGGVGFSSKQILEKYKRTLEERYGDVNYRNNEKHNKTCLEKYGVEFYSKTEEWKEKSKITSLTKFGEEHFTKTEEFREIMRNKHDEIQNKTHNTKNKNKTFNTSSIEEQIEGYFINTNIGYIRQYHSNLYPFNCDFYLPEYDLYIEINAFWTHGKHPFNPLNVDDIKTLNEWVSKCKIKENGRKNQYFNAIEVWTKRDPSKREKVKENKLNYLEIFSNSLDDCINTINNYIKNNLLCQKLVH